MDGEKFTKILNGVTKSTLSGVGSSIKWIIITAIIIGIAISSLLFFGLSSL